MRKLVTLVLLCISVQYVQSAASFIVTVAEDKSSVQVEGTFPMQGRMLAMPVWVIEGLPDGQASLVRNLRVTTANGVELSVSYDGSGSWVFDEELPPQPILLSYDVVLDHGDYNWPFGFEEVAYVTEESVFLVGNVVFITPAEGLEGAIEVLVKTPEEWTVAASWSPDSENSHRYIAHGSDDLLWNFFICGTHHEEIITIGDFSLTMIVQKPFQGAIPLMVDTMRPILQSYLDLFGGSRSYSYLMAVTSSPDMTDGGAYGGGYSMRVNGVMDEASRVVWGHGVAHELLHLWNGTQTIQPEEQEEWFKEGFTDYMTLVTISRLGLIDENTLFKKLENINRKYVLAKFLQRADVSIRDSGIEKNKNRLLVYGGGALVAFALDVQIRKSTGNDRGLNDLMRAMYNEFGITGKGYTANDVLHLANQISGTDLTSFFDRYVFGKAMLPMDPYLHDIGLQLHSFVEEMYISRQVTAQTDQTAMLKSMFGI